MATFGYFFFSLQLRLITNYHVIEYVRRQETRSAYTTNAKQQQQQQNPTKICLENTVYASQSASQRHRSGGAAGVIFTTL